MKFRMFYALQLPRPWEQASEPQLYHDALNQLELADRLGCNDAWEVEHHFLEGYSHSSAPEVFLAAASQRTQQSRLGHGIVQLTTNHPARVAERVLALELLSNGRVESGMAKEVWPALRTTHHDGIGHSGRRLIDVPHQPLAGDCSGGEGAVYVRTPRVALAVLPSTGVDKRTHEATHLCRKSV